MRAPSRHSACNDVMNGTRRRVCSNPGHAAQVLTIVDRVDPEDSQEPVLKVRELMGVQYVPLTPPSASEGDTDSHSDDGSGGASGEIEEAGGSDGTGERPGRRHAWHAPTDGASS